MISPLGPVRRRCAAPLLSPVPTLCVGLPALRGHSARARGRAADPTTSAVAYNLDVQFVDGPMAGRALDAGVVGTLDSTGLLTATLTAPSGSTSTVMGPSAPCLPPS